MGWLYVPGSEVWSWDSNSPSETPTSAWAMLSGKATQRPSSWRGWKTRPWIERLSGTISKPSQANFTARQWILSLLGSLASRGPSQANEKELMMTDGSGPRSHESFARWDHDYCFWKTSQGSLLGDLPTFLGPWPRWGSMRSGVCFQRKRSVLRTKEKGSSSWPTPDASGREGTNQSPSPGAAVRPQLALAAKNWATPAAADANGGHLSRSGKRSGELLLKGQAKNWATPQARDWRSDSTEPHGTHYPPLSRQVNSTSQRGKRGSVREVLNPRFDETLMGWPIGWTELEPVATEWSRWWQLMRSELWRLEQGL